MSDTTTPADAQPSSSSTIDVNTLDGPMPVKDGGTTSANGSAPAASTSAGAAAVATADGGGPPDELEAIICVPGIGESDGTRFVDVAERIATALDNCADSAGAYFTVTMRDAKTRSGTKLQSAAIVRHDAPDDAKGRDVLHLYEYDYRPRLGNGLEKRNPAVQAMAMAWTLAFNSPSIWFAWFGRRGKGWVQKLQVAYGSAFFFAILGYLLLLLVAGADVLRPDGPEGGQESARAESAAAPATAARRAAEAGRTRAEARTAPPPAQARSLVREAESGRSPRAWAAERWAKVRGVAQRGWALVERFWSWLSGVVLSASGAVVLVPLFGIFFRFNMREVLQKAAPTLASAAAYLGAGRNRAEIVGELVQVINHLDENGAPGKPYAKVHLAAYSFGSVVAIDALFPHDAAVNPRHRRIASLITIGCPYDFVRTYWPNYFTGREAAPVNERPRWINVYSPLDVLGSSFTDQPRKGERTRYRDAASAARRHEIRAEWDQKLGRGVELIGSDERIRPELPDNVAYGHGRSGTVSFWDWVGFIGFRAHGMYWSRESPIAITCFEPVVTRLFAGRKVLA